MESFSELVPRVTVVHWSQPETWLGYVAAAPGLIWMPHVFLPVPPGLGFWPGPHMATQLPWVLRGLCSGAISDFACSGDRDSLRPAAQGFCSTSLRWEETTDRRVLPASPEPGVPQPVGAC